MKNKRNLILGTFLIIALSIIVTSLSKSPDNINPPELPQNFHQNYGIFPAPIPASISFATENVPIQNFDVFESLDREILVNTYWQSQTLIFLKRAHKYFPIIEPILKENNIPDDFKYLAVAESGLANVTSPASAKGFWQFMKGTAGDYKLEVNNEVDERYHLEKSTEAACKFLQESYNKYGSWSMAAASYNMGRRSLSNQIERQKCSIYYDLLLGDESGRYVYRLIAIKLILENPAEYGFYIKNNEKYAPIPFTIVEIDSSINNLADFAHANGTNYKILKELNPWLRDSKLINSKKRTYEIKIPKKNYRHIDLNPEFYPADSLSF